MLWNNRKELGRAINNIFKNKQGVRLGGNLYDNDNNNEDSSIGIGHVKVVKSNDVDLDVQQQRKANDEAREARLKRFAALNKASTTTGGDDIDGTINGI